MGVGQGWPAVAAADVEMDMTQTGQSRHLRSQLEALDSALLTAPSQRSAVPAPRKINEGDDRWGGYP